MIFKIPVNASMRNKMYSLIEWVTIEQLGTVMILLTRLMWIRRNKESYRKIFAYNNHRSISN